MHISKKYIRGSMNSSLSSHSPAFMFLLFLNGGFGNKCATTVINAVTKES